MARQILKAYPEGWCLLSFPKWVIFGFFHPLNHRSASVSGWHTRLFYEAAKNIPSLREFHFPIGIHIFGCHRSIRLQWQSFLMKNSDATSSITIMSKSEGNTPKLNCHTVFCGPCESKVPFVLVKTRSCLAWGPWQTACKCWHLLWHLIIPSTPAV